MEMGADVSGHADADADGDSDGDGNPDKVQNTTGKKRKCLRSPSPSTAPVPAPVSKTSNLKTEENKSKDYMILKAGADGYTQPAAKGAGVMILVEEMTAAAF